MKRTLAFLLLCLAVISSSAQEVPSPQPTTPIAQVQLGKEFLARQDYRNAMTWYRKAADQGVAEGQANIGWLYQNGFGVTQDYDAAMTWYRKAVDQGDARAEADIGSLYESGLGVQQNRDEALSWYRKAAAHGGLSGPNGTRAPRAIYAPDPGYSLDARKAKLKGTVVLSFIVASDGQLLDIKVVKSLGNGLDEEAIAAVKRWKFQPATKDGKPVAVQINVEMNFHPSD